ENLQDIVRQDDCHIFYAYAQDDTKNPKQQFMQDADAIIVSGDSINMLCEACSQPQPAYYWLPPSAQGQNSKQKWLIASLEKRGLLKNWDAGIIWGWRKNRLDVIKRIAPVVETLLAGGDVRKAIKNAPDDIVSQIAECKTP
ncbi:MAG: ELM1/GtrOC1 family putative glycosyltransferase, partial [Pseudomonadota bacterium]